MGRKGFHRQVLERTVAQGYEEARIDGTIYSLNPIPKLARFREHDVEIIIGKWKRFSKDEEVELAGVVDEALAVGDGQLVAWGGNENEVFYSRRLTCGRCYLGMPSLDPRLFSLTVDTAPVTDAKALAAGEVLLTATFVRHAKVLA